MFNLNDFEGEEKRLLEALAGSLRRQFPNPERTGCPDVAVLRGLASKKLELQDVQNWMQHLSTCSDCFQQFTQFRKEDERKRRSRTLWMALSAAALIIVAVAGWLALRTSGVKSWIFEACLRSQKNRELKMGKFLSCTDRPATLY